MIPFSLACQSGGEGIIAENLRHEQRKLIKYNLIFYIMHIIKHKGDAENLPIAFPPMDDQAA